MKKIITIFLTTIFAIGIAKAQTISFGFTSTVAATTQTLTLSATASAAIPNNAWSTGRLALRIPISSMTGASYPPSSYNGGAGIGNPDPNFSGVSWGAQTGIAQWTDLLLGTAGITTFVPADFGAPNDGYVYIFTNYAGGTNGSMASGTPVTILQFTVPRIWNCANGGGATPCVEILDASFNSVPWISAFIGQVDLSISHASVCGGACNIATFGSNGPLPVKLASFSGNAVNCNASLQWRTIDEVNSDHFEVEQSIDGVNFSKAGNVKTSGISTGNNYSFTADQLAPLTYYRLKIVDQNNEVEYSAIIKVKTTCSANIRSASVFPNPANAQQGITINLKGYSGISYATIYSVDGKVISKTKLINGNNRVDIRQLAAGTYMVSITDSEGNTTNQKLSVSR